MFTWCGWSSWSCCCLVIDGAGELQPRLILEVLELVICISACMVDDDDVIEEMEKEEDLASASPARSIKTSAVSVLVHWDLHDSPECLQEKSRSLPGILWWFFNTVLFFSLESNAPQILLPAASSSYDSPIAATFRMQKKHTHNCRNLAWTRKKTTGVPSCCSEQDSRVVFLL